MEGRAFENKVRSGERKENVNRFISKGLKRDTSLVLAQMTKHQYCQILVKSGKRGRPPSTHASQVMNSAWQTVLNGVTQFELI